jgi:methionine synthase I (cobalamin-dependent)
MPVARPLIFQGPTGTILSDKGEMTDRLLLSDITRVTEMHRRYADAGAEVLITHTFNSKPGDMPGLTEQEATLLNIRGVEAARISSESATLPIAGCIGPERDAEAKGKSVSAQLKALLAAGVDYILFDSLYSSETVEAAVAGIRKVGDKVLKDYKDLKVIFSFYATDEDSLKSLWSSMDGYEPDYVGLNCIYPLSSMSILATELYELSGKEGVYRPACSLKGAIYSPEEVASELKRLSATIPTYGVGVCCGGTYSHIKELRTIFE